MFQFFDPGRLVDDDLELVLLETRDGWPEYDPVPAYRFLMRQRRWGHEMGEIALRIGHTHWITQFAGHIGYGVQPPFRGRRLAARSCVLLWDLARAHQISPLWITCNPDNWPSRRTCEILGGECIEVVPLPRNCDMYRRGERQKCRYRIAL